MNARILLMAMLALPLAARGGASADYRLAPDTVDSGGLRGTSANYTASFSESPGGSGSSASYTSRTGFAGQLDVIPVALNLTATPLTINENGTRSVTASLLFDDLSSAPLPATQVVWSILSGPLLDISPAGLVKAAIVHQDTPASLRGSYQNFSASLNLTVLNSHSDNSGSYAFDGILDDWQVQFFGLNHSQGTPSSDPDGDRITNLVEFALGSNPANGLSGTSALQFSGTIASPVIGSLGHPIVYFEQNAGGVDYWAVFPRRKDRLALDLDYKIQFSSNLATWQDNVTTPSILWSNTEMEVAAVPFPALLENGQKPLFFRLQFSTYATYASDGLPDDWQAQNFGAGNAQATPSSDADGDGVNNLIEFAFGSNPASATSGKSSLQISGTLASPVIGALGQPIVFLEATPGGVNFWAVFARRKNFISLGINYTVQFSADLDTWQDNTAPSTLLATDELMDVVSVPYPVLLNNGLKAKFFRVVVDTP